MTKKWSSTASGDGQTKRQASKSTRQDGLIACADDLPSDFGLINGEEYVDSIVARNNWNLAIEAAAKVADKLYNDTGNNIADAIRALSQPERR